MKCDCRCHAGKICKVCESGVMEKLNNLAESQVDIAPDFRIVINELASNSLDVNGSGNINA